jgi:hypothetical protein
MGRPPGSARRERLEPDMISAIRGLLGSEGKLHMVTESGVHRKNGQVCFRVTEVSFLAPRDDRAE